MKSFSFTVKMLVAESWIADGFQLKDRIDQIQEKISELLPYAYGHECIVTVSNVRQPDDKIILALQNGEVEAKD